MFGCIAETDWKPGSPLLWKGAADGKLYVKGSVVSIDAPHRLEYTIIDPNNTTIADVPENYLTMIYTLEDRGDRASSLEIAQGDFSKVAKGEQRYKENLSGGDHILQAIKKLAEAQSH
ncbi:MAG: SRPBCC domain-containing protein, partial [Silvibacterium sp.]